MGYAATRTMERVAASMGGLLAGAPIEFAAAQDVTGGGVLLALPSLLATGLLTHHAELYTLPKGYYGLPSIFLLLALMALARIGSLEQLRFKAAGEWGELLGLDRIPEVRTLREKLKLLCQQAGQAALWNAALAKQWMTQEQQAEPVFYADGHVRVYHGKLTDLPKHYVARQRLFQRASVDYWINAMGGEPFLCFNQPVDHGLVAALREDLAPWLEAHSGVSAEHQQRMDADPQVPRFTVIFDREGYSPELFEELWERRIAVINYHRYPKTDWPEEEFREEEMELAGGVRVKLKLAERESLLGRQKVKVREVRKLAEGGRQISIVSTHYGPEARRLAALLFARWSQENYFRYMRQHFGLDALVEYGTEAMPDTAFTVNPARRKLEAEVKQKRAQLKRNQAKLSGPSLEEPISGPAVTEYQLQQGQRKELIENLQKELDVSILQRQNTETHVLVKDLPDQLRFTRLLPERKYFLDTIKMISYRAEVSMASIVREKLARSDDAHALLRQIFETDVDLVPDATQQTLTVRLHHLTQRAHDDVIRHLCEELNATQTRFPGTHLKLIYKLGSS
jgi:hypothetical protein